MTRSFRFQIGFSIFTSFCFSPAIGQTPTILDNLSRLAGQWSGETILHTPEGEVSGGAGTLIAKTGPGSSVIIDYEGVSGRFADFRIHQVIAWNSQTGDVSMAWIDNFNAGLTIQTGQVSETELVFTPVKTSSGSVRESAIMNIAEESFAIQSRAGSIGGPMKPVMTLRFTRMSN